MYLTSFRMGDHPEHLVALRRSSRPVAVIANAMDGAPHDVRADSVQLEVDNLAAVGLPAYELDLRDYADDPLGLRAALDRYEVAWARGGNVFTLRHAIRRCGGDDVIPAKIRDDALVYAGYSAGPCVLAPSLRGLERCDDANEPTRLYGAALIWEGLHVLDYAIVPHIDTPEHPENEALEAVAATYRAQGVPHRTLRDGQTIVVDGDSEELV